MNRGLALAGLLLAAGAGRVRGGDFASGAVGTTGSEFLNIDVGARGIGMGGAHTALTQDAASMYWNPAGLAQVPKISAVFMHNRYAADINFDYLAYAERVSEKAVLAGAFRYMDAGSIAQTDINGNSLGDFRPRNYACEVGYGQTIEDMSDFDKNVSIGASGRFIRSDLVERADAFSGDMGVQALQARGPYPNRIGFVIQNVGKGQKFDRTRDSLPLRVRLGGGVQVLRDLLLAADLVFPVSNQPSGALGVEYALPARDELSATLRAGLDTQALSGGLDGLRGPTFGFGVDSGGFNLDYAYVPLGTLGDAHRVSIGWKLARKNSRKVRRR